MNALVLPTLRSARADIAIPQAPPVGAVPADLPPPAGPQTEPSPLWIGSVSVGLGLVLVGAVIWMRRRDRLKTGSR